jgi:hypothetical protein
VFVIGGGPSVKLVDLSLIHNQRVLGVNDAFRLGPWVDACYFGDAKWWNWNANDRISETGEVLMGFKKYSGLKMTSCQRFYHIPILHTWKRGKPRGIETKPGYLSWNNCSGLSAINVAYHFGAKRVVLIGFDMGPMQGKTHWHNFHKTKAGFGSYNNRYLPAIPFIVRDAANLGIELINSSPHTHIDAKLIKQMPLEDTIQ